MDIRRVQDDEVEQFVDDLWYPFSREMADLDPYNALADGIREAEVAFRREQFDDDDIATFVAADDGTFAGYTAVEYEDSAPVFARGPKANINDVYVVPDYRGNGLADDLMERAERWAADRGCEYVSLSVNVDNETARRVYESRGYATRRLKMDKRID